LDRPIWLCDVALLSELVTDDFDWSYCLAGRQRNTERLVRSIALAQQLLGARPRHCPWPEADVPNWLADSVLRRWGTVPIVGPGPSILLALGRPDTLPSELERRWPDPLEATLRLDLPLSGRSRWPAQVLMFLWCSAALPLGRGVRRTARVLHADR
jgi:hypothetical protein